MLTHKPGTRVVILPALSTAYRACEHAGQHGTVIEAGLDYLVELDSGKALYFGPLRVVREKSEGDAK